MPLKLFGAKKQIHYTIGIAAGKGGVGKSTLTVNLALALKALGYKVGILDADLYGPSIRAMLPETVPPSQRGESLIPAFSDGIAIMSMAFFKSKQEASVIRAPIASRLIAQFVNQVDWGSLDYLLIDFPPGTGDIQITLSQEVQSTGALIVTTPQEIALLDVRKSIDMFKQVNVPILGVVENMSYYQPTNESEKVYLFGKGGGERLALESGVPFLGKIPLDPEIRECLDAGKSGLNASSSIKDCFLSLARKLNTHLEASEKKPSIDSFELVWKELPPKSLLSEDVYSKESGTNHINAIRSIRQTDNTTFAIEWTDGSFFHYPLFQVQKKCPCAGCKENVKPVSGDIDVRARKIRNVGRYAIQIDFTSGCSYGIYDFDLLYKMKTLEAKL